jgi:type VI secretion system protein ImpM
LDAPTSEKPVLPIAFLMPVLTQLPVRDHWFLQGVLMPSCDKVGRPCPLVIYQFAHANWIQRQWLAEPSQRGQTLQYWWARLASLVVTDQMPWTQWVQAFDAVWAAHRPGLRQLMGQAPVTAPAEAMQALLGNSHPKDPMNLYCGVQHFPWLDWPARAVQMPHPKPAFWTQDQQGRYVHAGTSLKQLWGQQ